jgi:superfamily II DNA or RNA helicase
LYIDILIQMILTKYLFIDLIKQYKNDMHNRGLKISIDTLDEFIDKSIYLRNEFLKSNISRVKGDFFEYIAYYVYLKTKYKPYLFDQIPPTLREKFGMSNRDEKLIHGYMKESTDRGFNYHEVFTNVSKTANFHYDSLSWKNREQIATIIDDKLINDILTLPTAPIQQVVFKPMKLRRYQEEAIYKITNSKDRNFKVIMPCGTGKSLVMLDIIVKNTGNKVVCFFPSLQLIDQFCKLIVPYVIGTEILCICSDMDKETLIGNQTSSQSDKNYNRYLNSTNIFTTDVNTIKNKLGSENLIVLCTYQSSYLLKKSEFKIGLYDEAHKTANSPVYSATMFDKYCRILRRIYFTATLKVYMGANSKSFGMNDISKYGKDSFIYSFKQAIADGYILDFEIIGYTVPKEMLDLITETYIDLKDLLVINPKTATVNHKNLVIVNKRMVISAVQLALHILNNPNSNKILTYHNDLANVSIFKQILCFVFDKFKIKANTFAMSGNMSITNREKIFKEFKESKISVICSAKVLNEGIDLPIANTAMFVDPRHSTTDVIQCSGRIMRKCEDQIKCTIIIPIHYSETDVDNLDFSYMLDILASMKQLDDTMIEYFLTKNKNSRVILKKTPMIFEYNKEQKYDDDVVYDIDNIIKNLELKSIDSNVLGFDYNLAKMIKYLNEHNNVIPTRRAEDDGYGLSDWLARHANDIKSRGKDCDKYRKFSNNIILKKYVDDHINKPITINITNRTKYNSIFDYVNIYGKVPVNDTKHKNLTVGTWYVQFRKQIKINKRLSLFGEKCNIYKILCLNLIIKEDIDAFINETGKYDIDLYYNIIFDFIEENGVVPERDERHRYQGKGINRPVGSRFREKRTKIKQGIEDNDFEIYLKMAKNEIAREHIDKYMIKNCILPNNVKLTQELLYEKISEYKLANNIK